MDHWSKVLHYKILAIQFPFLFFFVFVFGGMHSVLLMHQITHRYSNNSKINKTSCLYEGWTSEDQDCPLRETQSMVPPLQDSSNQQSRPWKWTQGLKLFELRQQVHQGPVHLHRIHKNSWSNELY